MSFTILDCEQGTDEWFQARAGNITGSNFGTAKGESETRNTYLYKVAGELLTGEPMDTYQNDAMRRGTDLEPEARAEYEFENNIEAQLVGFCRLDGHYIGVSPDCFIGDKGMAEFKCPLPHTHIKYLDKGALPTEYKWQVYGQMWVCEREWCDFKSYHPSIKGFTIRVERDDKIIKELAEGIFRSEEKLLSIVEKLK